MSISRDNAKITIFVKLVAAQEQDASAAIYLLRR